MKFRCKTFVFFLTMIKKYLLKFYCLIRIMEVNFKLFFTLFALEWHNSSHLVKTNLFSKSLTSAVKGFRSKFVRSKHVRRQNL